MIADARVHLDMTQMEFAIAVWGDKDRTGASALSAIELGNKPLPEARWEKVAELMGVDHREFAMRCLRAYHPHAFGMIFGFDEELHEYIKSIPLQYGERLRRARKKRRATQESNDSRWEDPERVCASPPPI